MLSVRSACPHPPRVDGSTRPCGQTAFAGDKTRGSPEGWSCRGYRMASKTERTVVNVAGLVQGIVLVTFPAASTIFTSKSQYGLSSSQYGDMFLPQVALAIAVSLLGARLARRITTKRVYLLGLTCSTISMVLLLASTLIKANLAAAYPLLLVATAFLGAGFGLTVPVLNTYTSVFHPDSVDRCWC